MTDLRPVPAREEHYADFVRLLPELGLDDPAPERARWWAEIAPDALILEEGGRCVAYGWSQAPSATGFVRHVIVEPDRRGEGLGRRMMAALAERLRARGCTRWQLNVLVENAPAIALYRSLGLELDYRTWVVRLPPQQLAHLPRGARALALETPAAGEDAALERALDLSEGVVALFRGKQGHALVALRDEARFVAFAHFDPAYPGCFPFRALRPEHARALLEALLPHFPAGRPWFQLVVERDAALAEALIAAGAELRHSIAHMQGPLPPRGAERA